MTINRDYHFGVGYHMVVPAIVVVVGGLIKEAHIFNRKMVVNFLFHYIFKIVVDNYCCRVPLIMDKTFPIAAVLRTSSFLFQAMSWVHSQLIAIVCVT